MVLCHSLQAASGYQLWRSSPIEARRHLTLWVKCRSILVFWIPTKNTFTVRLICINVFKRVMAVRPLRNPISITEKRPGHWPGLNIHSIADSRLRPKPLWDKHCLPKGQIAACGLERSDKGWSLRYSTIYYVCNI
jgi:hypothetical protein